MLRRLEQRLAAFARRKTLAIVVVGLLPLLLRVTLLAWMPVPSPRVHDEFSHLLVADTLAHGRLVNPVHPMWMHFESMHTMVRPVYVSIFPIAPGFVMAGAQVLTGNPWIGVWLSIGLMCAALCWMLQGWVSPGWALLGGVLAAMRFGVFSYWMNSYYGGAVAAVGGALVLGALGRVVRVGKPRWPQLVLMGIGLAILANSRPFEGAIYAAPLVAALIWITWRRERQITTLVPLMLVICATAAALGYYCARVTGNPLQLPYSFYRSTFTLAPHFVWQSPRAEPGTCIACCTTITPVGKWVATKMRAPIVRRMEWSTSQELLALLPRSVAHDSPTGDSLDVEAPAHAIATAPCGVLLDRAAARSLEFAALRCPALGLMLLLAIEGMRRLRRWAGSIAVAAIALGCILTPWSAGAATPAMAVHARALRNSWNRRAAVT
jgi:hypothetical protein